MTTTDPEILAILDSEKELPALLQGAQVQLLEGNIKITLGAEHPDVTKGHLAVLSRNLAIQSKPMQWSPGISFDGEKTISIKLGAMDHTKEQQARADVQRYIGTLKTRTL